MKVFYAAVRDLIDFDISDCVIVARTYESAEKKLRKEYNRVFTYYEFELNELDDSKAKEYFMKYPDCKCAGIYNNAPCDYAYKVFI